MSVFRYRPAEDLERPLTDRLGQYPRVADITWDALRAIARLLARAFVRLQFRLEVTGSWAAGERVAYVANHRSHLDTLAILAAMPGHESSRIAVLAAKDYFFGRLATALAASLFAQAVSFDRLSRSEVRRWGESLGAQQAGRLLVYPSGSRRETRVHAGLLLVLARSGWTIVPLRLEGTAAAWPVGSWWWRPFRTIRLRIGDPVPPAEAERARELAASLERAWEGS